MNSNRSIIGLFFHSFNDSKVIENQGVVIGQVNDSYFLVQLFDWVTGSDSSIYLRSVSEMANYRFYETNEEMNDFYAANRTNPSVGYRWNDKKVKFEEQ